MNKFLMVGIFLIFSKVIYCQNFRIFVSSTNVSNNKYYLTTELINDSIIFFKLNSELKCSSNSIFGIAKRDSSMKFVSSSLYYNLIEGYSYIDTSLFYSPSNTTILFDFRNEDICYLSGINTGLLFGNSTKIGGKYSILRTKKERVFNCDIKDAIGSYTYNKCDSFSLQIYNFPHCLFMGNNITIKKGITLYYFPFYVNGYIPFFEKEMGVFWLKDSDIVENNLYLKL